MVVLLASGKFQAGIQPCVMGATAVDTHVTPCVASISEDNCPVTQIFGPYANTVIAGGASKIITLMFRFHMKSF